MREFSEVCRKFRIDFAKLCTEIFEKNIWTIYENILNKLSEYSEESFSGEKNEKFVKNLDEIILSVWTLKSVENFFFLNFGKNTQKTFTTFEIKVEKFQRKFERNKILLKCFE